MLHVIGTDWGRIKLEKLYWLYLCLSLSVKTSLFKLSRWRESKWTWVWWWFLTFFLAQSLINRPSLLLPTASLSLFREYASTHISILMKSTFTFTFYPFSCCSYPEFTFRLCNGFLLITLNYLERLQLLNSAHSEKVKSPSFRLWPRNVAEPRLWRLSKSQTWEQSASVT